MQHHIKSIKSKPDLCITSLRGGRAIARRHITTPCGDLGIISVDLVGCSETC